MELLTPENYEFAVLALLPGFIILSVYLGVFRTDLPPPFKVIILSAVISFFYLNSLQSIFQSISFLPIEAPRPVSDLTNYVVIPIFLGWVFGSVWEKISPFLRDKGVPVRSPVPTAWEHAFAKRDSTWIIIRFLSPITGKNGEYFAISAYYSGNCFTSSDINHKDIYLEDIHEYCDLEDNWIATDERVSMWIPSSQIQCIEFIETETNNG